MLEAGDQAERRRLAGAGRPEQHEEFTVGDGEVHRVDGDMLAEAFGDPGKRDFSHARLLRGGRCGWPGLRPCRRSTAARSGG